MLCTISAKAQLADAIRGIFQTESDSAMVTDSTAEVINQDSLLVAQLQQSLEEAKNSEVLLQQSRAVVLFLCSDKAIQTVSS